MNASAIAKPASIAPTTQIIVNPSQPYSLPHPVGTPKLQKKRSRTEWGKLFVLATGIALLVIPSIFAIYSAASFAPTSSQTWAIITATTRMKDLPQLVTIGLSQICVTLQGHVGCLPAANGLLVTPNSFPGAALWMNVVPSSSYMKAFVLVPLGALLLVPILFERCCGLRPGSTLRKVVKWFLIIFNIVAFTVSTILMLVIHGRIRQYTKYSASMATRTFFFQLIGYLCLALYMFLNWRSKKTAKEQEEDLSFYGEGQHTIYSDGAYQNAVQQPTPAVTADSSRFGRSLRRMSNMFSSKPRQDSEFHDFKRYYRVSGDGTAKRSSTEFPSDKERFDFTKEPSIPPTFRIDSPTRVDFPSSPESPISPHKHRRLPTRKRSRNERRHRSMDDFALDDGYNSPISPRTKPARRQLSPRSDWADYTDHESDAESYYEEDDRNKRWKEKLRMEKLRRQRVHKGGGGQFGTWR